jgi:osmotically-inducible protein OsmY
MTSAEEVSKAIVAALEHERRINLHRYPISVNVAPDGTATLEGEVDSIAAKKLALELAASVEGVGGIIDRLRVEPAQRMGDGEIRDHVLDAFENEPTFADLGLRIRNDSRVDVIRSPIGAKGSIEVSATDGVVTLNGQARSLSHKRLAGVLAWWVPGTRDVINGIEVLPPEDDSDDEITEAVRLVLEKDPLVNADAILIGTKGCVVTLGGIVTNEQQKQAAEKDTWCVFGVDKVINRLSTAA